MKRELTLEDGGDCELVITYRSTECRVEDMQMFLQAKMAEFLAIPKVPCPCLKKAKTKL